MRKSFSLTSVIKEESSTGTGATFTSGQGEQYASNFGFKKKRKKMTEADSWTNTPEARVKYFEKAKSEYDKAKADTERYMNIFKSFSLDELLESDVKAKKIISAGEVIEKKFGKYSDDLDTMSEEFYDEGDKVKWKEYRDLGHEYYKLSNTAYVIIDSLEDIISLIEKVKEKIAEKTK